MAGNFNTFTEKGYTIFCNFLYIFIPQTQQIWSQDFNKPNFEKKNYAEALPNCMIDLY